MTIASYTKLRSGQWGARIDRDDVKPGDRVVVGTRSMKAHSEEVDRIIWRGDGFVLCSLVPRQNGRRGIPRKSAAATSRKH